MFFVCFFVAFCCVIVYFLIKINLCLQEVVIFYLVKYKSKSSSIKSIQLKLKKEAALFTLLVEVKRVSIFYFSIYRLFLFILIMMEYSFLIARL
tara:strand:+ start:7711 stop:7992 length:282 start_codon:yes stop_codon:yes gene_type:complete